jgi:hypothetical protein
VCQLLLTNGLTTDGLYCVDRWAPLLPAFDPVTDCMRFGIGDQGIVAMASAVVGVLEYDL